MTSRTPSRGSSRSRPGSPTGGGGGGGLADRFANVSIASTDAGGGGGGGRFAGDISSNVFFVRPPSGSSSSSHPPPPGHASSSSRQGSISLAPGDSSTLAISQAMGGMALSDRDHRPPSAAGSSSGSGEGREGTYGHEKKRSIGGGGGAGKQGDRFIPQRGFSSSSAASSIAAPALGSGGAGDTSTSTVSSTLLANESLDHSTSSVHGASLPTGGGADGAGGGPGRTRILAFAQAPPSASTAHDLSHAQLRRYTRGPAAPSSSAGSGSSAGAKQTLDKRRKAIAVRPERILDAPGMVDDYYLNLLAWSKDNMVGIGLGEAVYVWNADSGGVSALGEPTDESPQISSLTWAGDGSYLAVGNDVGEVEVWDVETSTKLRTMAGHASRVPVLSWHGHLLSSGCRDGSIHHHDVRVARHKVGELQGHTGEVCGLTWRGDGQLLASGGNDNVVNCWDARANGAVSGVDNTTGSEYARENARWTKRNHTAAVKALAWCPWQPNLLATGGGTGDQTIHFWSSTTGSRVSSLPTPSQVTSLIWSPHTKEILSTHGFPDNNLCLWSYPSLDKVWDAPAHDTRVLASALSPDGGTVATAASDENLKFWKIWDARAPSKGKGKDGLDDDGESIGGGGGGASSKGGKTGGIKIR